MQLILTKVGMHDWRGSTEVGVERRQPGGQSAERSRHFLASSRNVIPRELNVRKSPLSTPKPAHDGLVA